MSRRRGRWTTVGVAASALLVTGARIVHAGCGVPPLIVWAPPSGTRLPANPTIYVFVRQQAGGTAAKLDELTVTDGDGRPVAFTRADLHSEGTASVVRLDVKASAIAVSVRGQVGTESGEAKYRLGARARETALVQPEITEAQYLYGEGCPSSNGFLLSIDPQAPAYRVELDGQVWIVPDGEPWRRRHGTIVTGTVGCDDFAIPTDRPLALFITPLDAAGNEGATRMEGCVRVGPRPSCHPIGHGETRCTSMQVQCTSGGTSSVTGRVVRDSPVGRP